jgi:hypothetical protein
MFQSRRSLLTWKVFGERLDGWTNDDHPTERVPGNPATLPEGAEANDADLDFDGNICPPPGTAPALTEHEKRTIARWIDLGAPIDVGRERGEERWGFYLDDLRPTLTVSLPERDRPVEQIRFAAYDAYSGLDESATSVVASFAVGDRPPGTELFDLFEPVDEQVWQLDLPAAEVEDGWVLVTVRDRQGNRTTLERRFSRS